MDLHVVRSKGWLLWPSDFYPAPAGISAKSWRRTMERKPQDRVRGTGGYVVDLDAPLEREWCAGQVENLQPRSEMPKKRGRPKAADKIEFAPALAALQARQAELDAEEAAKAPVEPRAAPPAAPVSEASPEPEAPEAPAGEPEAAAVEIEGRLYISYQGALVENWAGRYETPEGDVTHLLATVGSEPVPIDDVTLVERPVPLQ